MKAIPRRLPSPAMLVACVALIVALGGVSYAAGVLPKNSVGASQLRKNAVASGKVRKDAITTSKVKNGTLLAQDLKAGQLPAGPQGPKGDSGAPGPAGAQGPKGDAGAPGEFPDRLPSGKTLRGTYVVRGNAPGPSGAGGDAISFGLTLANPPTAHLIRAGGPGDPNCPGTAVVPEAGPGHLCVYERAPNNVGVLALNTPLTSGVVISTASTAAGFFLSDGAWAVTAP